MTDIVKLGVPVVITIDQLNLPPEWWGNFNNRDITAPLTDVEREVTFIQKNSRFWIIFPSEAHYTWFLMKWN